MTSHASPRRWEEAVLCGLNGLQSCDMRRGRISIGLMLAQSSEAHGDNLCATIYCFATMLE